MKFKVYGNYLLIFTFSFVFFTITGTVSHEYGHIIAAKYFGYETTLHYASMNYENSELSSRLSKIFYENQVAIESDADFVQKEGYEKGLEQYRKESLLITIAGPLQTILTGVIGLLILFSRRKVIVMVKLKLIDWLAVFLSLFWLREVFNVSMSLFSALISSNDSYFGGDERIISEYLNLWPGTISIILGILVLAVSLFIIFKVVPYPLRFTFILGGFIGCIFGFLVWMNLLGSVILP